VVVLHPPAGKAICWHVVSFLPAPLSLMEAVQIVPRPHTSFPTLGEAAEVFKRYYLIRLNNFDII